MQHLGGMDTMFVRAETRSMLLHVTGVLVLDPGSARPIELRDRLRRLIEARIAALPPLQWRLVEPPGGIGALRWIDDPDFDVDHHVRLTELPSPGTQADLERATAEIAARRLDRSKPLWEMHVVADLADGTVAVIGKFHHALIDGSAGLELIAAMFDLTPDVADVPDATDATSSATRDRSTPVESPADTHGRRTNDEAPDRLPSRWRLAAATPLDVARRIARIPAAIATLPGLGGLVGAMFPNVAERRAGTIGPARAPAPRTRFNGTLGTSRAVALTSCSLADAKAIAAAYDVKVNDVVLAAVTSALHASMATDGHAHVPLVAAVPVSVRSAHPDERFGNQTSAMMIPLPTDLADPVLRLEVVAEAARHAKAEHATMGGELIERWAGVIPPWLISTGARLASRVELTSYLPPICNLIVSNVAGPPVPLYLAGAEVIAIHPLGPLLDGTGLNISVVSQLDRLHVGIICDPELVPDPGTLAAAITEAIDELVAATSTAKPDGPRADAR